MRMPYAELSCACACDQYTVGHTVKVCVKKIEIKSITINHKRSLWNCWFHKFEQINYECKSIFGWFAQLAVTTITSSAWRAWTNGEIVLFFLSFFLLSGRDWWVDIEGIIAGISLPWNGHRLHQSNIFDSFNCEATIHKIQIGQLINSCAVHSHRAVESNKCHSRMPQDNLFGISLNMFQFQRTPIIIQNYGRNSLSVTK